MPARFVIHTVGPVWGTDREAGALLASCYRKSIALAAAHGLKSIAFPAISTGAYGYPKDEAAVVASRTLAQILENTTTIDEVHLVFFAAGDRDLFIKHQCF